MSTDTDSAPIVAKSRLQAAKAYAQKHYDSWGSKVIDSMSDQMLVESIANARDLWEWARNMKAEFSQSVENIISVEGDLSSSNIQIMPDIDPTPVENRVWRKHPRPQNIRVGKYFMLSDFLYSEQAVMKGIPNCPPLVDGGKEIESIKGLCKAILDPVVDEFGCISITFGYTSPALAAKINFTPYLHNCCPVKAKRATIAAACDILVHSRADDPRSVLHWIRDSQMEYDRLILYPDSSIVCIAWADRPRYDAMEWAMLDGKKQYVELR